MPFYTRGNCITEKFEESIQNIILRLTHVKMGGKILRKARPMRAPPGDFVETDRRVKLSFPSDLKIEQLGATILVGCLRRISLLND